MLHDLMKKTKRTILLLSTGLLVPFALAMGGPNISAFSVSAGGGMSISNSGNVLSGNDDFVATGVQTRSVGFDRAFDDFYTAFVEIDLWENERSSLFFNVSSSWASGRTLAIGQVGGPLVSAPPATGGNGENGDGEVSPAPAASFPVSGPGVIVASFSDYRDFSLNVGIRHLFTTRALSPYVAGSVGFKRVDSIDARITGVNGLPSTTRLYEKSDIFAASATAGLALRLHKYARIGADISYAYQGRMKDDDTDLAQVGLQSINRRGGLTTVPVRAYVSIIF